MPTTITFGAQTIAPQQVLGYTAERESRSITHDILGRANPDVTLRPAGLRTGTLTLGFQGTSSETASKSAADWAALGAVGTLADTDRASIAMSFIASGRITRELEDESRDAWLVTIEYQEVTT